MHPKKDLAKAIDGAIDRCIEEGVLREFLMKRREEVTKVTQLDYTFDRRIELEREDAREEALAEERVNTERERQAKEEERQRAEQAEKEVQRLRAELEQYKRQLSEARNQVSWKQY